MRKKFVAGNWKMNLTKSEGIALVKALTAKGPFSIDVAVIPAFVHLDAASQALVGSNIGLGAQDVYFEKNGAFTGEVSLAMLQEFGTKYVLVGHSERRHVLGEKDELLNKKLQAIIAAGLTAILCVGETLQEREANKTFDVVGSQLRLGLAGVDKSKTNQLVIAYEPVWAIGTGKTASPEQAQEVHAFVRQQIAAIFDPAVAAAMRIQYGGSVKASNAKELLGQADIDGALVGGASLKAEDFLGIIAGA
ncbi:MAG: triose-phosphate isomerase [Phycisphaerae bacterium]